MKPAPFDYVRPATLAEAIALCRNARAMAGGQSLGPMLNLRLARPLQVVALARLPELWQVEERSDAITLGAAVTHSAIADGRTPDVGDRILARIASGIAYRAVRNRGTIGGSLAHADPAADWLCTLTALGAGIVTSGQGGTRLIPLDRFVVGAFRTALESGEIVQAVRVRRPGADARWGYYKACRKPGEFAHAMAAFLDDPASGRRRAVIGAVGGAPVILEDGDARPERVADALAGSGLDAIGVQMQTVALRRAIERAAA